MLHNCLRKEASKRTVYLFGALVFLLFFVHFAAKHHIFSRRLTPIHRRLQTLDETRPCIYTYFDAPTTFKPNDPAVDLVETWKKAWFDVGWDPRIISENDCRMIPDYQDLMALLTDESFLVPDAVAEYKRWIAMAGVGGGWMADLNTFPLNYFIRHGRTLPNGGMLTTYGGSALVSGTGHEYFRVVRHIGATFAKHVAEQKDWNENYPPKYRKFVDWNVKKALEETRKKISKDMYKSRMEVWVSKKELLQVQWTPEECQLTDGKRAVQFGGLGLQTKEGALMARRFVNMWRTACSNTPVVEIDA